MTLKEQIMKLQTYKMFEGEDTVYVERDDVIKVLEQVNWIPVTERLPKKSGKYLVTVKNGNVYAGTYDAFSGKFQCAATAWQPLPDPYKVESEDN